MGKYAKSRQHLDNIDDLLIDFLKKFWLHNFNQIVVIILVIIWIVFSKRFYIQGNSLTLYIPFKNFN